MARPIISMPYLIEITETAKKEITKKVDASLIDRLDKRIQKLAEEPKIFGKPLRGPLAGIWEIRFERRWRLWYTVDDQQKRVIIVGFRHKDEM